MNHIKETILSCATHRGLTIETLGSIQACAFKGVTLTQGIADVALARCHQFKKALEAVEHYKARYVLFVDDDMVWTPAKADTVIEESKEGPISARYVSGGLDNAKLAASPLTSTQPGQTVPDRFLTGLGFLAMEALTLQAFISHMPRVKWGPEAIPAVTSSGPVEDRWFSEDYVLTMNLGGVRLSAVEVGHVKPCTLLPSMFSHLKEPDA